MLHVECTLPPSGARTRRTPQRRPSTHDDIDRAFWKFLAETALIEFRDKGALQFIAFGEKGEREGEAGVPEDFRVLSPSDHRARAHHGRKIAPDERIAGKV